MSTYTFNAADYLRFALTYFLGGCLVVLAVLAVAVGVQTLREHKWARRVDQIITDMLRDET